MPLALSYPNRAASATYSGQGWTAALPLAYLNTRQLSQVARSGSAATTFYLGFAAPTLCDVAALAGHNLTTSGQWRLRGYSSDPRPFVDRSAQIATVDLRFSDNVLPAGLSCTRASVATYFGADGLLKTAAVNEARIQHAAGVCIGLLVEPAATNNVAHCRDWTQAAWTRTNMTATLTATGIDGVANSATRLTATAANATVTQVAGGSGLGSFSVFVRRVSGTGTIQLTSNSFTNVTAITLTSAWQRFTISAPNTSTIGIRIVTNGDVIEVDFAQKEVGSSIDPTTPILTAGAGPVTRAADDITYTPPVPVSLQAGTMVTQARYLGTAAAVGVEWLRMRDAGNTNAVRLLSNTSRNVIAEYVASSLAQASLNDFAQPNVGAAFIVALSWAANDYRSSLNGATAQTDNSGSVSSNAVQSIRLASPAELPFAVARLTLLPAASTSAQVETLSTAFTPPAAAYDSGLLPAWPAEWVAATTAEERAGARGLMVTTPGQTLQWWRVDLSDPTNPAGFVELGRVFMGSRWRPQYGALSGATLGFIDRSTSTEADSGAEYFVERPLPRVAEVDLVILDEAVAMGEGLELQRQLGTTGEVLFQWDDGDTTYQPARAFLGRLRTLQPLTCLWRGHWRSTLEIKELL